MKTSTQNDQIIIIGAGIIGLCVAEMLSRNGFSVCLVDRHPQVAQETSHVAAGMLAPEAEALDDGPYLKLLQQAAVYFPELVTRLEVIEGFKTGFRPTGVLEVALTEADAQRLEDRLVWQQKAGLNPERLSRSEVLALEPQVSPDALEGVFWPQAGQVDAVLLAHALEQVLLSRANVTFELGVSVTRLQVVEGQVQGVALEDGRGLAADRVVNCSGAWSNLEDLPFRIPLEPIRGQVIPLETQSSVLNTVVKTPRAYMVQRSERCLLAGATMEAVGFDRTVDDETLDAVWQGACEILPSVKDVSRQSPWIGFRPTTPDLLPVLGKTPIAGLFLATGHYRNGILLAPLTGRLVLDWMYSEDAVPEYVQTHFGLERFSCVDQSAQ